MSSVTAFISGNNVSCIEPSGLKLAIWFDLINCLFVSISLKERSQAVFFFSNSESFSLFYVLNSIITISKMNVTFLNDFLAKNIRITFSEGFYDNFESKVKSFFIVFNFYRGVAFRRMS